MATNIGLKIDPTGEDAANVVLDLNDGTKFKATSTEFPTPDRDVNWASSANTEGALPANLRYQNRTITLKCWVFGTTASDLQTQLGYLQQKIGKVNNEGATLEYVSPSTKTCIFDLLEGAADFQMDILAANAHRTEVTITFTAKPFWRSGISVIDGSTAKEEKTLPCAIMLSDKAVGGDVPAVPRLTIADTQGADQWTLLWGVQVQNYSNALTAELFYEAESRTILAGEKKAGPTGASGAGENTIFCGTLIPAFQPIMSTRATGAGAHLTHVGTYRVFARIYRPIANAGAVSVALEWSAGDYLRPTVNEPKTYAVEELENEWTLVDLGLVHLSKQPYGFTQKWEGRVIAKSTVNGDDIYIDYFMLFPVDEGYGELKTVPSSTLPTTLAAHDEFDQTEGNLDTPKALPLGGNWAEAEKVGAEGFKVIAASHTAQRAKVSDATLFAGSYAIAGTAEPTASKVSVTTYSNIAVTGIEVFRRGVFLRYVDTNNWLMAFLSNYNAVAGIPRLVVVARKEGTLITLGSIGIPGGGGRQITPTILSLQCTVDGKWQAWAYDASLSSEPSPILSGELASLATGGALAKGKVGFFDSQTSATACTRSYDNFVSYTGLIPEAAVPAKGRTAIQLDRVTTIFEGSSNAIYRPDYKGSYFKLPPAGREARSTRVIAKLARGNIDTMGDPAIDDITLQLEWQTRGLVAPDS